MNRRLLLGYLGVTLFVLVALEVPLGVQNQRSQLHDLESKVTSDAWVLVADAEDAVQTRRPQDLATLARIAFDYAQRTGARVVIVEPSGTALIDTSSRVAGRESFASRPEVASALSGRVAVGTRRSSTLRSGLVYVAVPIGSAPKPYGAVRITYSTSTVDHRILRYWLLLAAIAAIVLAAAALVGMRLARFVTRPLAGVEQAAAAVGEGDLEARAPEGEGPPEVRSLARVLNETVTTLAQLLRSQEEFVADASHELRTPLTALRLRIEIGDVEGALHEVDRLAQMVESLLALARADAGTTPAAAVDAAATVRDRVETWRALADERDVAVAVETDGAVLARTAPDRLAQVLDNLVANAVEHAPRGTTVTVSAQATATGAELRVRDSGPGMSEEQRARAFDRFWRAGSGAGGSGLGLAIVRKLVEADDGRVELAPAPGGGTEAIVRLPRG